MYNRAHLKQEMKQTIASTRPRPMWIALLYLVITSVGASLIQSVITLVSGTSFLSELYADLYTMLMTGGNPMEVVGEFLLLYANQLGTLIGTVLTASILLSIVSALWQGLMSVGFDGYCLSLAQRENPTVGRIFCGFPLFGKVVLTSLLVWVFTTLWTMLWTVCLVVVVLIAALLMEAIPVVAVLLIILGCIGYMILVVRVSLRYAMTNYILLDTGKYGLEAISESKQMMKGRKGKLFMLHLSFIGWYLLMYAVALVGSLIVGIVVAVGFAAGGASMGAMAGAVGGAMFVFVLAYAAVWLIDIWLQPYMTGSVAKFYLFFRPQPAADYESWPSLGDTTTTTSDDTINTEY